MSSPSEEKSINKLQLSLALVRIETMMLSSKERLGRRIARARHEAGLTAKELAAIIGKHPSTIYSWESGRASPRHADLMRLAEALGKEPAWFLAEEGEADVEALIERQQRELEELRRLLAGQAEVEAVSGMVEFPVIGIVGAGNWDEAIEASEERLMLPEKLVPPGCTPENSFILRVNGDSMIGAGIEPGSYVLVRRTAEPRSGDLVVVREGNSATLKRYMRTDEGVLLVPENSHYRPIRPGPDTQIIGRVELIIRRP